MSLIADVCLVRKGSFPIDSRSCNESVVILTQTWKLRSRIEQLKTSRPISNPSKESTEAQSCLYHFTLARH